jgi:hypothetical protein
LVRGGDTPLDPKSPDGDVNTARFQCIEQAITRLEEGAERANCHDDLERELAEKCYTADFDAEVRLINRYYAACFRRILFALKGLKQIRRLPADVEKELFVTDGADDPTIELDRIGRERDQRVRDEIERHRARRRIQAAEAAKLQQEKRAATQSTIETSSHPVMPARAVVHSAGSSHVKNEPASAACAVATRDRQPRETADQADERRKARRRHEKAQRRKNRRSRG